MAGIISKIFGTIMARITVGRTEKLHNIIDQHPELKRRVDEVEDATASLQKFLKENAKDLSRYGINVDDFR